MGHFEEKSEKENKPGDPCTTDDGEDGVYETQDGQLVCMPVSEDEPEPQENSMKSGRVISAKSRKFIETAIEGIKGSLVALEELLKAVDLGGEDDGTKPDEGGAEQRSNTEPDAKKDFKEWNQERQVLRMINNITSDALRKYNEKHHS